MRRPGQPGPKQFTPLTIAGYMALAGLLGGAALAVAGEVRSALAVTVLSRACSGMHAAWINQVCCVVPDWQGVLWIVCSAGVKEMYAECGFVLCLRSF